MERRLEVHHRPTPASEPIAGPISPARPPDVAPTADLVDEKRGEVGAMLGASALLTDRLVERLGHRRLAEIRARLASGAYGSREVIAALAIRMLESGDLA